MNICPVEKIAELTFTKLLKFSKRKTSCAVAIGMPDRLNRLSVNLHQSGTFFIQNEHGRFSSVKLPFDKVKQHNDALFFDADNDGDQDLYVVSGGNHLRTATDLYQDQLYWNDGIGNFTPSKNLPEMHTSGAVV